MSAAGPSSGSSSGGKPTAAAVAPAPATVSDVVLDVAREAGVGLNINLHPLPILSISEHLTRTRVQLRSDDVKVYGVLLGTQTGRDVEIQNSFELKVARASAPDAPTDVRQIDHQFLQDRQAQFKQVFPNLDLVGWYSVGATPTLEDLIMHQQLSTYNESLLFLQLSPTHDRLARASAAGDLPLSLFESVVEIVGGATKTFFLPAGYKIESGEAERIAVEHTSREKRSAAGGAGGAGAGQAGQETEEDAAASSLLSSMETSHHAIRMLSARIKVVRDYVAQVLAHAQSSGAAGTDAGAAAGAAPAIDHEALRQISALCSSLAPADEAEQLNTELRNDYEDVLLMNQLSALTSGAGMLNELIDKFDFTQAQAENPRPRQATMGGMSLRSRR